MQNPRLAGRYAKSLLDLALEKGKLEEVYGDMQFLLNLTRKSRELVNMLKSPVIPEDRKITALEAVTGDKVSELTRLFNRLLVKKGREAYLPEIASAFIRQYKAYKKIYTVQLTTAHPVSEQLKQEILSKLRQGSEMEHIELEAKVDENLVGGFVLQIGDQLVDASIEYDLQAIRKQFLNNDFIYKIR